MTRKKMKLLFVQFLRTAGRAFASGRKVDENWTLLQPEELRGQHRGQNIEIGDLTPAA
jgi:hypothetical protein